MAFADPQSVTINGSATSLPRVSSGDGKGTFRKDDTTVEMTVSHQYGKRNRSAIRLTQNKVVTDPLVSTVNVPVSTSVTLVVDTPTMGFTLAEKGYLVAALCSFLTASSNAKTTQFLGGEA